NLGRAENVWVVAPYMEEPGTQLMVNAFENIAATRGWQVQLIQDTVQLGSLLTTVIGTEYQPDAIVINLSSDLIHASLEAATSASIPIIGMDADDSPLLLTNITSDPDAMAAETSSFVVEALEGDGGIIMIVYEDYAPVQKRGVAARAVFDSEENIDVIATIVPDVSEGSYDSAREQLTSFFDQHTEASKVSAIWSAWDEPALGALAAVENREEGEASIIITGIDATPAAIKAISEDNGFRATVAQDFQGIAAKVAHVIEANATESESIQAVYYVPATLLTDQPV
ncbi:MAG: substrate-binding domain-containing protein, partial [Pseudomonadota bacterium]